MKAKEHMLNERLKIQKRRPPMKQEIKTELKEVFDFCD